MLKYIQLELRRNRLRPYLAASVSIVLALGLFGCFMPLFPRLTAWVGEEIPYTDITMFTSWETLLPMLSTLSMLSFSILSAAMHTRYIVEEYTGKRLLLLFSYPASRRKILWAKCCLVFLFTLAAMFLGNLATVALTGLLCNLFRLTTDSFGLAQFREALPVSLILSFVSAAVGMIAMRIGFRFHTGVSAIVAAVLCCSLFSNLFATYQGGAVTMLVVMAVLLFISFLIFCSLLKKVNRMEAL